MFYSVLSESFEGISTSPATSGAIAWPWREEMSREVGRRAAAVATEGGGWVMRGERPGKVASCDISVTPTVEDPLLDMSPAGRGDSISCS